ncbi:MAG: hypothetical protein Q4E88_03020 [Coriobacteriia bacterium]|nr:hypothetical protein [Coriobacteriia bacterium]
MKLAKTLRYIVLVLLILVVLSSLATTGIFAKFTSSGTGNDSARVAKWSVDVTDELSPQTGQTISKSIDPSSPKEKFGFTATNTKNGAICETLTKYGVTVNVGQTLPQGVSIYINPDINDDPSTRIQGTPDPSNPNIIKFANTNWQFQPAVSSSQTLYLFFVMDSSCTATATISDISVVVNYEQAQS